MIRNITRHTELRRDEATVLHIKESSKVGASSLAQFDEVKEIQRFYVLRMNLSPCMYDEDLDWLLNRAAPGSKSWLLADSFF